MQEEEDEKQPMGASADLLGNYDERIVISLRKIID